MAALLRRDDDAMKDKYDSRTPLVSGETVTPGKFRCRACGYVHEQAEGVRNLPVCPRCQGEEWELD